MRRAAIKAGLVANETRAQDRISFVTEGEASLHYCIHKGIRENFSSCFCMDMHAQPGEGLIAEVARSMSALIIAGIASLRR